MSRCRKNVVWAEMARRKVQFHPDKEWDKIELWGLFQWGAVSPLLKSGELLTRDAKENKIIWVRPTQETWEKYIKPLVESRPLDELTALAGW
jgi:hypothetical protein